MKILKEFRDFILTGNVINLSVAVILAGAVSMVVNGFTEDIMMPIVGQFSDEIDFSDKKIILSPAVGVKGEEGFKPENAIRYGAWVNALVNLVIVGFILFVIVKAYGTVRKPKEKKGIWAYARRAFGRNQRYFTEKGLSFFKSRISKENKEG